MKKLILLMAMLAVCTAPLTVSAETYYCGGGTTVQISKTPPSVVFQAFGHLPEATVFTKPTLSGRTLHWKMSMKEHPACVFDMQAVFLQGDEIPPFLSQNSIELKYAAHEGKCASYGLFDSSEICGTSPNLMKHK